MFFTTKAAMSATVLNCDFLTSALGGGSSGSAPLSNPTTAGALAPSPDAPWQSAQCSPYSFCPCATCSANVAGAGVAVLSLFAVSAGFDWPQPATAATQIRY